MAAQRSQRTMAEASSFSMVRHKGHPHRKHLAHSAFPAETSRATCIPLSVWMRTRAVITEARMDVSMRRAPETFPRCYRVATESTEPP